ncbi:MAG: Uma2 family endonuclease [Pirellulaceae bacterium]|nr:Uma2 family endonuclease [Pirellulaceae bacterium]
MPHVTDNLTTAEQLAAMPDDGKRYELVEGVLHMMSPAGGRHGRVAGEVFLQVAQHAKRHRLGHVYAAETGFLIRRNPDTVRAPDVAYVSLSRLGAFIDHPGYLPVVPELVAEVVSTGDRASDVESKAQDWLDAGVHVVLVVDPQTAAVRVYRQNMGTAVSAEGHLDLDDILPGFRLDVSELFA